MATLEDVRKWLRGAEVPGLPKRTGSWAIVRPDLLAAAEGLAATFDADLIESAGSVSFGGDLLDHRFSPSSDGRDAMLRFGRFKGRTISSLADSGVREEHRYLHWMRSKIPTAAWPAYVNDALNVHSARGVIVDPA